MSTQIMPGIRQPKRRPNIGSGIPEIGENPHQINEQVGDSVWDEENARNRLKSGLKGVDPLAYYCAYLLVTGMDEMVTGGGYCQIGEQRYSSLEGAIRAITGDKPVVELGEVVKRKQYKYPRQKKKVRRERRWKKADVSKEALDRMVELARLLMAQEAAEGEGGEAAG